MWSSDLKQNGKTTDPTEDLNRSQDIICVSDVSTQHNEFEYVLCKY